jgi:hypothetical protein
VLSGLLLALIRALRARAVTFTADTPAEPFSLSSSPPNCVAFEQGTKDADLTLGGKLPASASILFLGSGVVVYQPLSPLPGAVTGDLALSVSAGQEYGIEAKAIRQTSTLTPDGNGCYFTVFYPAPAVPGGNP